MSATDQRHVVLLASSRPRGNTHTLARSVFPEGTARFIDLNELRLGYYSYDYVNDADAFNPLVEELLHFPVWHLATPLYWYTMSAQAKTFLDRLSDLLDRQTERGRALRGKSMSVICSGTDESLPSSFDQPFQLTCRYLGMRYIGSHYARFAQDAFACSSAAAAAATYGRGLSAASG